MYKPFNSQDSVMLLVDHQVGTMSWVGSISFEEMKRNALMLAKSAAILGIPYCFIFQHGRARPRPIVVRT